MRLIAALRYSLSELKEKVAGSEWVLPIHSAGLSRNLIIRRIKTSSGSSWHMKQGGWLPRRVRDEILTKVRNKIEKDESNENA